MNSKIPSNIEDNITQALKKTNTSIISIKECDNISDIILAIYNIDTLKKVYSGFSHKFNKIECKSILIHFYLYLERIKWYCENDLMCDQETFDKIKDCYCRLEIDFYPFGEIMIDVASCYKENIPYLDLKWIEVSDLINISANGIDKLAKAFVRKFIIGGMLAAERNANE